MGRECTISRRMLIGLAALALLLCVACAALPYLTSRGAMERVYEFSSPLSDTLYQPHDASSSDTLRRDIDWDALRQAQPNVAAWVTFEDAHIDYPIVQSQEDSPEFYLSHDFWDEESPYGCPYLDCDLSQNEGVDASFIPVYGHHLIDGSMFSGLTLFTDSSYASEHRRIAVETPKDSRTLEIFAVRVVDADKEGIRTRFSTPDDLQQYLDDCLSDAVVVLEHPQITSNSHIWAFITCSYGRSNERTIVLASERAQESISSS